MDSDSFYVFIFLSSVITGLIGRYVALQKGRSLSEGFIFGFFLSFIGVIIVAVLPNIEVLRNDNDSTKRLNEKSNNDSSSEFPVDGLLKIMGVLVVILLLWYVLFPILSSFGI